MWAKLTRLFIRKRRTFLLIILGLTAVMDFFAKDVKLSYEFAQVIPLTDPDYQYYLQFKKQFGEDGDLMIIGFHDKNVFIKDVFNDWQKLGNDVSKISGISAVLSVARLY